MYETICGADCSQCPSKDICGGCVRTQGKPFNKLCLVATCCLGKGHKGCSQCQDQVCDIREKTIAEFNALGIKDMPKLTQINELRGALINLEYTKPNGEKFKLLDDAEIYLGTQVIKEGTNKYYGLAANEEFLVVSEYGENGADPELIVYKKRNV